MADEILLRKAEYLLTRELSWDEFLRKVVELLYLNMHHYHWVGIYLLHGDELVLHSYLGKPTEHTRIPVGVGVCGAAVAERKNRLVPDVTQVENYLACSLETRSEIVVLVNDNDDIIGQIDIDSDKPFAFGPDDESLLNQIATLVARKYQKVHSAGHGQIT